MSAVQAPSLPAAEQDGREQGPPTRAEWRRRAVVGSLFVALVLLMIRPTPGTLGQPFVDLGDPLLLRWSLSWSAHSVVTDPLHLFDANIFWPHGLALAYTDSPLS
jgi:hypothetical protein